MIKLFLCVFPLSDIAQLEQDTVLGVQSLLMLCSQDSSPSAQATLKVRGQHGNMAEIEEIQREVLNELCTFSF